MTTPMLHTQSISASTSESKKSQQFVTTEIGAVVERGNGIEAIHYATIAVVTPAQGLVAWLGDPDQLFYTRSSIKPFQALEFFLSGAADHYQFTDEQLALMCASHNGTDQHKATAQSILDRCHASAADLQCGTHLPTQMRLFNQIPTNGEEKDPLRHNCSGKHSGFLALASYLKEPLADYLNPNGVLQKRILKNVALACDYDVEKMPLGIDGCSAPNVSMPVVNLAKGFLRLATGTGWNETSSRALKTYRDAMLSHPILVAGERRFDYDLMRALPGRVVSKIGAEACEGIGVIDPPMGIAVKIHDGADRALGPVCVRTLIELGVLDQFAIPEALKNYFDPTVKNYRGTVTGKITTPFHLHRKHST